MNVIGTIFYNWDEIESSVDIRSDLLKEYVNSGSESFVYNSEDDYVYKVSKLGFSNKEEFNKYLDFIKERNTCPVMLEQEYVGCLKHLIADVYHPVFKQKKIQVFEDVDYEQFVCKYITEFMKSGWIPKVTQYSKGNQIIWDINPRNCGLDENGNIKIIDCMIYNK